VRAQPDEVPQQQTGIEGTPTLTLTTPPGCSTYSW
jgi:hypothetical protein